MTNKTKVGLAIGAGVVLLFLLTRNPGSLDQQSTTPLHAEITTGPMTITVIGHGEVRAKEALKVLPKIKRSTTISFLIPEGDRVSSNQVIARFNPEEIDRRISDLEAKILEAENQLDDRRTELEIQIIDNTTAVKTAKQHLEASKLEYEKFEKGDQTVKRRNATLDLMNGKSAMIRAQRDLEESKTLLKQGFITEDEVEETKDAVEAAKINMETAQLAEDILEKYDLPTLQAQAENTMNKAATEAEKTQKQNTTRLRNKERAVTSAERRLKQVKEDLAKTKEEREAFEVHAPADGVVQYGSPEQPWRNSEIQVGMNYHPGSPLMTIPDLSELKAVVNVAESDIRKVVTGQVATITIEALEGKTFSGEVIKVAEVANKSQWLNTDVREFQVDLSMANFSDMKPGFSCQAEIVCNAIAETIQAPIQAVFRDENIFYVYIKQHGGAKKQLVTIGKASTTHIQILEGVTAGQAVYLSRPDTAEDTP